MVGQHEVEGTQVASLGTVHSTGRQGSGDCGALEDVCKRPGKNTVAARLYGAKCHRISRTL